MPQERRRGPKVWQLIEYIPIAGVITCLSGTHIGISKDEVSIGDNDSPVIRHPWTNEPYIPGSSLKGKMRSISEYRFGAVVVQGQRGDGEPHGCQIYPCVICQVFGPHKIVDHEHGPTRLIVRDAGLAAASAEKLVAAKESAAPFTEIKTENWIDRRTGVAGATGLRSQERVAAGTQFALNLSVRRFADDDREQLVGVITTALDLINQDTLGGSGTRGYGWVKIDYTVGEAIQAAPSQG
jgi:CRISPR-associated protein Csm3